MTELEQLSAAVADRYTVERALGAGGMVISHQPSAFSRQRSLELLSQRGTDA